MLESVNGIVLKTNEYGETHKIATILTKETGKVPTIARGANKPKSKMAALTQPFIYGHFYLNLNKKGLSTLQQGEVIDSLRSVREDIFKTAYAAYIVELTDKLMDDHDPDPFLFKQLYLTLNRIGEDENPAIPLMMYELKMFQKGGFAPVIDKCAVCHRTEPPFVFSIGEGGFLCRICQHRDPYAYTLSDAIAKWLLVFATADIERVGRISVKSENIHQLRTIFDEYYDRYGGYRLKAKRFLKQLDKLE